MVVGGWSPPELASDSVVVSGPGVISGAEVISGVVVTDPSVVTSDDAVSTAVDVKASVEVLVSSSVEVGSRVSESDVTEVKSSSGTLNVGTGPEPEVQNPGLLSSQLSPTSWQHAVTPLAVHVWTPSSQAKATHSGTPLEEVQVSPISQQPFPSAHNL